MMFALALSCVAVGTAWAANNEADNQDEGAVYAPGRVIVGFDEGVDEAKVMNRSAVKMESVYKDFSELDAQVMRVDEDVEAAVTRLEQTPGVRYAEPDFIHRSTFSPNDPLFQDGTQYGPRNVKAPEAWDVARGDARAGADIGIIDTGYDRDHQDLANKVSGEYDCASGDGSAEDLDSHGTHVSGTAAAITNNDEGVAGLAPDAQLFEGKALNDPGFGSTSDIIECSDRAANAGVEVLNYSLGSSERSQAFQDAIDRYATEQGINVVASAGNDGCPSETQYPAAYEEVVAVAATNEDDQRASFSSCGQWVDLAAPGVEVISTVPSGEYDFKSGTSMSAPHVAGGFAVLRSADKSRTEAEQDAFATATDLGPAGKDKYYGRGLIDFEAAVRR